MESGKRQSRENSESPSKRSKQENSSPMKFAEKKKITDILDNTQEIIEKDIPELINKNLLAESFLETVSYRGIKERMEEAREAIRNQKDQIYIGIAGSPNSGKTYMINNLLLYPYFKDGRIKELDNSSLDDQIKKDPCKHFPLHSSGKGDLTDDVTLFPTAVQMSEDGCLRMFFVTCKDGKTNSELVWEEEKKNVFENFMLLKRNFQEQQKIRFASLNQVKEEGDLFFYFLVEGDFRIILDKTNRVLCDLPGFSKEEKMRAVQLNSTHFCSLLKILFFTTSERGFKIAELEKLVPIYKNRLTDNIPYLGFIENVTKVTDNETNNWKTHARTLEYVKQLFYSHIDSQQTVLDCFTGDVRLQVFQKLTEFFIYFPFFGCKHLNEKMVENSFSELIEIDLERVERQVILDISHPVLTNIHKAIYNITKSLKTLSKPLKPNSHLTKFFFEKRLYLTERVENGNLLSEWTLEDINFLFPKPKYNTLDNFFKVKDEHSYLYHIFVELKGFMDDKQFMANWYKEFVNEVHFDYAMMSGFFTLYRIILKEDWSQSDEQTMMSWFKDDEYLGKFVASRLTETVEKKGTKTAEELKWDELLERFNLFRDVAKELCQVIFQKRINGTGNNRKTANQLMATAWKEVIKEVEKMLAKKDHRMSEDAETRIFDYLSNFFDEEDELNEEKIKDEKERFQFTVLCASFNELVVSDKMKEHLFLADEFYKPLKLHLERDTTNVKKSPKNSSRVKKVLEKLKKQKNGLKDYLHILDEKKPERLTIKESHSLVTLEPKCLSKTNWYDAKDMDISENLKNNMKIAKRNLLEMPIGAFCQCHGGWNFEELKKSIQMKEENDIPNEFKEMKISFDIKEEVNVGFQITFYKGWQDNLCSLLKTDKCIFPIFMPSKGRSNRMQLLMKRTDKINKREFLRTPRTHLIYLVVEEQEKEKYLVSLKEMEEKNKVNFKENVVLVTIPGKNRGIGFSRSCIKMLQQLMRCKLMEERKVLFNQWWMIDDDVKDARIWDYEKHKMIESTLDAVLVYCQTVMHSMIDEQDQRIIKDDKFEKKLNKLCCRLYEKNKNDDIEESRKSVNDDPRKFLALLDSRDKQGVIELLNLGEGCDKMLDQLFEFSKKQKEESVNRVALASPCRKNLTEKNNYNLDFTGREAQYRVVKRDCYACVLVYSPGVEHYNYLTFRDMLLSQEQVDEKMENERLHIINEDNSYFLGEDKRLNLCLAADKRAAVNVFCVDIGYSNAKTGGCFYHRENKKDKKVKKKRKRKGKGKGKTVKGEKKERDSKYEFNPEHKEGCTIDSNKK